MKLRFQCKGDKILYLELVLGQLRMLKEFPAILKYYLDGRGCDIVVSKLMVTTLGLFGPEPTLTNRKFKDLVSLLGLS